MKKFQKIFFNTLIVVIFMGISCISTMFYCVGLPTDEHVVIQTRALNYFDKTCYSMDDIEMIVFGAVQYDNRD